jgi:hypothetical protein
LPVGRVGADQRGKGRLDRPVARDQGVVFGVRDLGRVLGMIKPVVPADLGRERLQLGGGGFGRGGQRVH